MKGFAPFLLPLNIGFQLNDWMPIIIIYTN